MSYFVSSEWAKNQYQELDEPHTRHKWSMSQSLLGSLVLSFGTVLLIIFLWNSEGKYQPGARNFGLLQVDPQLPLHRIVAKQFLSFGLDSSLLRPKANFPIDDERFINLARFLSPAYVRVGGTAADCLTFNQTSRAKPSEMVPSPVDGQDISNFTITQKDFYRLSEFTKKTNLRMIFDLNVLRRRSDWSWDQTNAKEIIQFAKAIDLDLHWQLGNEPNSFLHVFNVQITPQQLAKDYRSLRKLLDDCRYKASYLIGPEVNHINDQHHRGETYLREFLLNAGDSVDFVSWHQYYLNGREAGVEDFLNPETFDILPMQIRSISDTLNSTGSDLQLWLSETGSAFGGGAPDLSNRFVAGFLWLDKLGYGAASELNVVIRQSFFGGYYSMVNSDLSPNPDWWVAVLFKKLVSEKVLKITNSNNFGKLRFYAHCAPENLYLGPLPDVTIYGMNLDASPARISISGFPQNVTVFFYGLTADDLQSRKIKLNGQLLELRSNGELPDFEPLILVSTEDINIPAHSMVFMIIQGANVPACRSS